MGSSLNWVRMNQLTKGAESSNTMVYVDDGKRDPDGNGLMYNRMM